MSARDPALQALLDALMNGLSARAGDWAGGGEALARVRSALARVAEAAPGNPTGNPPGDAPPAVAAELGRALDEARSVGGPAADTAEALAALLPQITWYARQGGEATCEGFADRHALATLVGPADRPGVLEVRDDVRIGVTLVSPETPYPDHRHPPEELYLALTSGAWRQELGPWFEPGPGGAVYNSSNILHGMHSGRAPQLALWCLPI